MPLVEQTMPLVERRMVEIKPGTWQEYTELEKEWNALEREAGWPPKTRYYKVISGEHPHHTFIWEREWEDWAAMGSVQSKVWSDEHQARAAELYAKGRELYIKVINEFYWSFTFDEDDA